MQYFFFSYARNDSTKIDGQLRRFYDDLCRELSTRGRVKLEETGYIDVDQPPGTIWSERAGEAVGSCKVFVPVYSPWYFASGPCGQEWHGFDRRLEQHRLQTGNRLASMLPVWWLPPEHEPPATKFLHDTRDQFGLVYRERGLRSLMTLPEFESDYRAFLEGFARQLCEAGRTSPRELTGIDLETEPNAFAERVPRRAVAPTGGPKWVNFFVAAGTNAEMQAVREHVDTYGEESIDWAPYRPALTRSAAWKAQHVATEQGMYIHELAVVDEDLKAKLQQAEQGQQVVVLIVDPWVVGLDRYRDLLAKLADRRSMNMAILLPGTEGESRPLPNGVDAGDVLRLCFGSWLDEPRCARQDLGTVEKFEEVLKLTMIDIKARIVSHGEVTRRVQQRPAMSRPIITGPEA